MIVPPPPIPRPPPRVGMGLGPIRITAAAVLEHPWLKANVPPSSASQSASLAAAALAPGFKFHRPPPSLGKQVWEGVRSLHARRRARAGLQAVHSAVHLTRAARSGSALGRHEVPESWSVQQHQQQRDKVACTRELLATRASAISEHAALAPSPAKSSAPWLARACDALLFR